MNKNKKILITGGSGFVGTNLIETLNNAKKYEIKIFSRKNIPDGKFIIGDLKYFDSINSALKKEDIIIHLANSKNYPENVEIMKNLVKAAKEKRIKKIIFISSMSAKRKYPDDYGKSKIRSERILRESGINYTILRPSIIYGKGSTGFNFLIERTKKIPFFTPIIGNGKYRIAPVYIGDVIESIEDTIENEKTNGKEYDIVGGEDIFFVDLINVLKKETGDKKINIHIPLWICNMIAICLPKVISKNNIRNLTEDSYADIKDAKKDFDYNPIKFEDGIKNGIL